MSAVYRRELKSLLRSWNVYVAIILVAAAFGWYGFANHYQSIYSTYEGTAGSASVALYLAVPLITMGLFSDDKRQGTDRLLAALPVRPERVALGKVLAALTVSLVCVLVSSVSAWGLCAGTSLYSPSVVNSIGYTALVALAATAVCAFLSMGAPNRLVGFLCGAAFMALCYFASDVQSLLLVSSLTPLFMLVVALLVGLLAYALVRSVNVAIGAAVLAEALALVLQLLGYFPQVRSALISLVGAFDFANGYTMLGFGFVSLGDVWTLLGFICLGTLFASLSARELNFKPRRAKA